MNNRLIEKYSMTFKSDDLKENIRLYFEKFDRRDVFEHTLEVVEEVHKLHAYLDFDLEACVMGAYMHDVGRVVQKDDIIQLCSESGHTFTSGEKDVPFILHQFASRIIGQEVFGIDNDQVLGAIQSHTTLKAYPNEVEKIVFLSDKLSWKANEHAELIGNIREKSQVSIDRTILHYLSDLHEKRHEMKCYHEWSEKAYKYFSLKTV